MPRIRNVKPEFFSDDELADRGPDCQILFAALWTLADRDGRLEGSPRQIKAYAFPYREVDVEACLSALAKPKRSGAGFIIRYEVGGRLFVAIP